MAGTFDRAAILESFLKELQAYLPEIEGALDRMKRQGADPDTLEEIYRRVHTIAGSAAMMDLAGMASVATAMETIVGDALDGATKIDEPTAALLRRSVMRLRQMMDLVRTGGDDSAIVAQDHADHAAARGQRPAGQQGGNGALPRMMGGPGSGTGPQIATPTPIPMPHSMPGPQQATPTPNPMPSAWNNGWNSAPAQSPSPYAASNQAAPQRSQDELTRTTPLRDLPTAAIPVVPAPAGPGARLADAPLWQHVAQEQDTVRQSAGDLVQSIGALRDLSRRFDGERNELLTFLDGSKDALDRLEQWAGQAMGIDLRTSPDHVRRYLPLSVLWVVTARMKGVMEILQDTTRSLATRHETLNEALDHLRDALGRAGQMAGGAVGAASLNADGGFTASVAQFSYAPSARKTGELSPGQRAELERTVREDLRRDLEEEVRAEMAIEVRREEERRLRQELEIQLRRQLLAEFSPAMGVGLGLGAGMEMGAGLARPATAAPRRVVIGADNKSSETIEVFRAEAEEHLRTISDGIGLLERNSNDSEAIRSVRRAMHTLKGAAAITGFNATADLAHICEDLLDRMGDGSIPATPDVISLILDTSQALEALASGDTAEQGGENGILAALRPRYQTVLGETVELDTPAGAQGAAGAPTPRQAIRVTDTPDDEGEVEPGIEARAATERNESDLSVRLPLRKLDELITLFGDILVNRSVVEERMERLTRMVADGAVVSERLREVGGQMEKQFEVPLLQSQRNTPLPGYPAPGGQFGNRAAPPPNFGGVMSGPNAHSQADFDPLELDRYSEFHRLSRGLAEGITDASTLSTEMEATLREVEVVLLREGRLSSLFQDALLKARLVPISSLIPRLYRAIKAVANKYGKEFELLIEGDDTEVDRGVYEDIVAPMLHLVRNAIYHGIETPGARQSVGKPRVGQILLGARYEGNQLVISVRDDGNGMNAATIRSTAQARGLIDSYTQLNDRELINLIFQPGFSTSESISEEAGRGIGLDVVRDTVTRLRGTIEVDSLVGQGTTFTMKIPISLQIQRVVLVRVADQIYAIPMTVVEQLVQLDFYPRSQTSAVPALEVRGETYPLVHLGTYLTLNPGPVSDKTPVLLVNAGQRRWAVMVDAIAGRQEIVSKSLGPHLRSVPSVSGATVLGNGSVVLILDAVETLSHTPRPNAVVPTVPPPGTVLPSAQGHTNRSSVLGEQRVSLRPSAAGNMQRNPSAVGRDGRNLPYILVVDDSPSVRRVVSQTLKNAGWEVLTARDGAEALEVVAQRIPVGILLDIEMPRMDGYELMAALRSQPMYQQIPLIVLTSRAATKHQQRALQLGADAYVVKPYQDDQLLTTINALVTVRANGDPR